MKKIILYGVSLIISMMWLILNHQTIDPFSLKGPEFLKFYLIFLFGFYTSVIIMKYFKEQRSNTTIFFMIFILAIGIIKLIKGLILGKPVGYLVILLGIEFIVILCQSTLKSGENGKMSNRIKK
ncbi:hypothetical protein CEY12_14665 [Chryseobacterium sp. T16E-39]|uniref:hypothetical protein n=1 Tax=Chryseobacterium sp. T16E-39 TaxID=2015076 RepID=UPI000B5B3208|nr:hypothetical protein [Chryseobacterium sp. T16E-39]ASK31270.1 hypothetical protein CEY12_14665 [Chryseobacterium sp. T16E-39]